MTKIRMTVGTPRTVQHWYAPSFIRTLIASTTGVPDVSRIANSDAISPVTNTADRAILQDSRAAAPARDRASAGVIATSAHPAPSNNPPATSAMPSDNTMLRMFAGSEADRPQQADLAAAFEHVARQHRAQSERAEQQAQRSQRLERRQVGVLNLVIRRPALMGVADVDAVIRETVFEVRRHRGFLVGAGVSIIQTR